MSSGRRFSTGGSFPAFIRSASIGASLNLAGLVSTIWIILTGPVAPPAGAAAWLAGAVVGAAVGAEAGACGAAVDAAACWPDEAGAAGAVGPHAATSAAPPTTIADARNRRRDEYFST